jgi:hypothetical protein
MSNGCTYPGEDGASQSQNMEMPSGGAAATEEVCAVAKEKRRSKNFRVEEDKLLVSA